MSVLDELRKQIGPLGYWTAEDVQHEIDAFEAAHPGIEDHTTTCVVCGGPMKLGGSTVVFTTKNGRTLGRQHKGCVGKPARAEVTP